MEGDTRGRGYGDIRICTTDSFVIKQKLIHHCKAIILQQRCFKKKKNKLPQATLSLVCDSREEIRLFA